MDQIGGSETPVSYDRLPQVLRPSIVEEELPLAQAPQGRGAKLIPSRVALEDVVGQSWTHVMEQQIGEEIDGLLVERRAGGLPRRERRRVAQGAADPVKQTPALLIDGVSAVGVGEPGSA